MTSPDGALPDHDSRDRHFPVSEMLGDDPVPFSYRWHTPITDIGINPGLAVTTGFDHQLSDDTPPEVDYPDDHSPYCRKDCDHPCHDPYDVWVASRDQ